jgi:S1-C subfamily serine protease
VGVSRGLVKGWMLAWDPSDARMARVVQELRASFRPVGDRALDPGLVPLDESARQGLLSGLELRKPRLSRSGFYVDAAGAVLTTTEAVAQCGRITLDGTVDATVTLQDDATGIALLAPVRPLSPPAVAGFQLAPDRIGAEVAVSGYSYGDRLSAPVLTFGTLADSAGLDGETGVKRLSLAALPGDAGGPVVDGTGAVLGMLLPRATGSGRVLPDDVALAATGAAIAELLAPKGVALAEAVSQGAMAPEDLARKAARMTVLVSCWD